MHEVLEVVVDRPRKVHHVARVAVGDRREHEHLVGDLATGAERDLRRAEDVDVEGQVRPVLLDGAARDDADLPELDRVLDLRPRQLRVAILRRPRGSCGSPFVDVVACEPIEARLVQAPPRAGLAARRCAGGASPAGAARRPDAGRREALGAPRRRSRGRARGCGGRSRHGSAARCCARCGSCGTAARCGAPPRGTRRRPARSRRCRLPPRPAPSSRCSSRALRGRPSCRPRAPS